MAASTPARTASSVINHGWSVGHLKSYAAKPQAPCKSNKHLEGDGLVPELYNEPENGLDMVGELQFNVPSARGQRCVPKRTNRLEGNTYRAHPPTHVGQATCLHIIEFP